MSLILHAVPSPDLAKEEYDPHAQMKLRCWRGLPSQESIPGPSDSEALFLSTLCLQRPDLHQWAKNAHLTNHHLASSRRAEKAQDFSQ